MGCVTGKGLAALFRENFGVRISFLAMLVLFLINTLHHVNRVRRHRRRLGNLSHLALHRRARSRWSSSSSSSCVSTTRSSSGLCRLLADLSDATSLRRCWPTRLARGGRAARSSRPFEWQTAGWLATVVGVIGTTISPYMQFFLQSAVVEKGSRDRGPHARAHRRDQRIDPRDRAGRIHDHRQRRDDLHGQRARRTLESPSGRGFRRRSQAARRRVGRRASLRSAFSMPASLPRRCCRSRPLHHLRGVRLRGRDRPQVLARRRSSLRCSPPDW